MAEVDDIHDMSIKESENAPQKSVISEQVHPGFMCFFKQYLNQASITFDQCLQSLIEGSNQISRVKLPVSSIFKKNDISSLQKVELLKENTNETKNFLYFFKDPVDSTLTS